MIEHEVEVRINNEETSKKRNEALMKRKTQNSIERKK
jgi:hypothetical protein